MLEFWESFQEPVLNSQPLWAPLRAAATQLTLHFSGLPCFLQRQDSSHPNTATTSRFLSASSRAAVPWMALVPCLFRDKALWWETTGRKTDVQRQTAAIHAKMRGKSIETELPGANSQPWLQRVAVSTSEREADWLFSKPLQGRLPPRQFNSHLLALKSLVHDFALCWFFFFCYRALYFSPWWCKYISNIQSLELLPNLPCLERKETLPLLFYLCSFQHSPLQRHSSYS